jgi:hypothetical protein
MATSQNGYRANDRDLIRSYTIPRTTQKLALRAGDVAKVLLHVADRFNREVEPIHDGWCWGYAERNIKGSSTTLSNHASGTAEDLNAPAHPLGTQPSSNYTDAQISAIHRIVRDCKGVIRWGGDYSGRKDGMHWEINAGLSAVSSLARSIDGASAQPTVTGEAALRVQEWQYLLEFAPWRRDGIFGPDTLKRSERMATAGRNADKYDVLNDHSLKSTIALIQRIVDVTPDGIFGPKSSAATHKWVRQAQEFLGVTVDGYWGPNTQKAYEAFRDANYRR